MMSGDQKVYDFIVSGMDMLTYYVLTLSKRFWDSFQAPFSKKQL